jgi:RNA-binding protein
MKPLTEKQKRHLKALAHPLNPVIIVGGAGVTEALLKELDSTLEHHELIKVRVNAIDREARDQLIAALCEGSQSLLVQRIGHIAVLYRPAKKPQLKLPRD